MTMRLIDCFLELVTYVSMTVKDIVGTQTAHDQVRSNVTRLLSKSEACLESGGIPPEDAEQAKFAICAWIDEMLLSITWDGRQQWQKEQLQRQYFKTTRAGEEFFDRLNGLGVHQRDVREVYFLCLGLGFSGRYIHDEDRFLLNQLRGSNLKLLFGSSVGVPSLKETQLFPEALPLADQTEEPPASKARFSIAALIGLTAPVLVFAVLYAIYALVLDGYADNILTMVPQ